MPQLKGTKTHSNLKDAFAGESQANRRYLYFAKQADVEGHPDIAGLFRDTADGETGHAHGHLDYLKSVGIAVSAGYDCDNQAATVSGLLGVMHGAGVIPRSLTRDCVPGEKPWEKPFNDTYINYSRDDLPIHNRISDLVARIVAIAETAILREGGRKVEVEGKTVFFLPPAP